MARTYAMANNTYVRVVMAKSTYGPYGATRLVILPIYSADGSLDQDSSTDMRDASKWPALSQAVVLDQMELSDTINAIAPDTQNDALPGDTASDIADFIRRAPGLGSAELPFNACVQFQPSGEARVSKGIPARYIRIAVDGSGAKAGRNPFILRVSGASGSVDVLRVGEQM
ncbi:hypothetical protein DB346_01310 [Verrucomicrobia bacterium LW23]|nr:hypothetical protein DB346_01310 [Verrucomicrobia bacterium LW23]